MAKKPHVVVVPLAAQGHLSPLMKLAHKLANSGINVTVINLETVHRKIVGALSEEKGEWRIGRVRLVGVPDGLQSELDQNDPFKRIEAQKSVIPAQMRRLVEGININEEEEVVCMISDVSLAWPFHEAKAMGIKTAGFSPASAASLALVLHLPGLLGILDHNGYALTNSPVRLGEGILAWETNDFPWSTPGLPDDIRKMTFEGCANIGASRANFDYLLVNSFEELEPSAMQLIPNIYPVGPLFTSNDSTGCFRGSLWPEDQTCSKWLDQQAPGTAIYVAFGSFATIQTQQQFSELALGLELTGKPFLWVVRPDHGGSEFPDGFLERVGDRGKIVEWANQEKVLSHSSMACFVSHCGWNSTLDGLVAGVPFLCWPFCFDQFHNTKYICETWKIGLELIKAENGTDVGMITKAEIARKVDDLLSDETIKSNSMKLRKMATLSVADAGSSFLKLEAFVQDLCSPLP
ncbi:UDP-glycosyltransferase 83A1 [Linum grandiflorum]